MMRTARLERDLDLAIVAADNNKNVWAIFWSATANQMHVGYCQTYLRAQVLAHHITHKYGEPSPSVRVLDERRLAAGPPRLASTLPSRGHIIRPATLQQEAAGVRVNPDDEPGIHTRAG